MEQNNQITDSVSRMVLRIIRVLRLASDTLNLLGEDGFSDPNGSGISIPPEKIIGETAFLLLAVSKYSRSEHINSEVRKLVKVITPFARNNKTAINLCIRPALALEYAQAHICLTRIGYPDCLFDNLLSEALESSASNSKERAPHRMLEQAWIKRVWRPAFFDAETVIHATAFSALANPMDLIHGTTDDYYGFTHALMYLRNFNESAWSLPRRKDDLIAEATSMLAHCLLTNDYDLAGELLLTWPLTGSSWNAPAQFVFQWLAAVEDADGFLPMEKGHQKLYLSLEGENKRRHRYTTGYHTAYVMGLLCATCAQQSPFPLETMAVAVADSAFARVSFFLQEGKIKSSWLSMMETLPLNEQDKLAGLLLDVLIVQRAREKDFSAVHRLLRLGSDLGLADGPLAAQAAELLGRLSLLAEQDKTKKAGEHKLPDYYHTSQNNQMKI